MGGKSSKRVYNIDNIDDSSTKESITCKRQQLIAANRSLFNVNRRKEVQRLYATICEDARINNFTSNLCAYIDLYKTNRVFAAEIGFDVKAMEELYDLSVRPIMVNYKICSLKTCQYYTWLHAAVVTDKYHACRFLKSILEDYLPGNTLLGEAVRCLSSLDIVKLLMEYYNPNNKQLTINLESYINEALLSNNTERLQLVNDILKIVKERQVFLNT